MLAVINDKPVGVPVTVVNGAPVNVVSVNVVLLFVALIKYIPGVV